jgi:hypothetical protein
MPSISQLSKEQSTFRGIYSMEVVDMNMRTESNPFITIWVYMTPRL